VSAFTDKLNDQLGNEFAASQQDIAIAVWHETNILLAESYLARTQVGDEGTSDNAPPAAGGAL
jgi:ferritin